MMKLYGSPASPFVRKVRLLFGEAPYQFIPLNIYENDRETIKGITPVMKIPVLDDNGQIIFDSRMIFNYWVSRGVHPKLDWKSENDLTVIDAVLDSMVNLLLLKRSNVELPADSILGRSHSERISSSLDYLEKEMAKKPYQPWNYLTMSLYTLMDWSLFRELQNYEAYPSLLKFFANHDSFPIVRNTDPRNAK